MLAFASKLGRASVDLTVLHQTQRVIQNVFVFKTENCIFNSNMGSQKLRSWEIEHLLARKLILMALDAGKASQKLSIAELETSRQNLAFRLGPGPWEAPQTTKMQMLGLRKTSFEVTLKWAWTKKPKLVSRSRPVNSWGCGVDMRGINPSPVLNMNKMGN